MSATVACDPFEAVVARLTNIQYKDSGLEASCPVAANHDNGDPKRHLSVTRGEEGRVLVYCHRGCATDDVLAALGLTYADLFPRRGGEGGGIPRRRYRNTATP